MRIATRGSALARWQAERVAARLGPDVELVVVETTGDRRQDLPIHELGGQGVFVKEVQAAVLDGRADLAVHSAKDLPSLPTPGLVIAAYPERGDQRDALVGAPLATATTFATGSVRRRLQLAAARPDAAFTDLRGNVPTRLERVPAGGAVVVALAALQRLGAADRAVEVLSPAVVLPQVGQGALAVECREGDAATLSALAAVDDAAVRRTVEAERAFLARLGGGCELPVGALAALDGEVIHIEGFLDGRRDRRSGPAADGEALGDALARSLLR
ncbi:MAG: hydroxymethylbilane synthase [Acidimicrobiales bacterium]